MVQCPIKTHNVKIKDVSLMQWIGVFYFFIYFNLILFFVELC
jgi:hypothetical protein